MRKVDKLLLRVKAEIEAAQRLDENVFCYALVMPAELLEEPEDSPNYNKWETLVYLNKGKFGREGTMLDALYFDTKAEAMAAAKEIEAVHTPTGKRTSTQDPIYITMADGDEAEE